MRPLIAPSHYAAMVYQTCINSITDQNLRARLKAISVSVDLAVTDYEKEAPRSGLFKITEFLGNKDDIVVGCVSRLDLTNLYDKHMVVATKPARRIYDELKLLAPLDICPFCALGQVKTLDHYLPKAKYPYFSVTPINLIPACRDCNTGKGTKSSKTADQQCIHPYFDHDLCIDDQWLFAVVNEAYPASISYFVKPPKLWSSIDKARVRAHFSAFDLSDRYSIQATTELATLSELLIYDFEIGEAESVRKELRKRATVAAKLHSNSWETAMFQALAESDWYCEGGFCEE